ncbi:glycosyltransferase family 4 protein [Echinicola soli]|uniref:Glycosyltransferase family 4 protein n=1 Tax=Echinicola soli TaxID=2591634 RepID=A0A514CKQ7_9BACT|nr:glycosyltransferase family 4 protein [Echinicola soli]QDH80380.1 glycosyltransferase family 4 protein [Echinicola soli]
MKKTKIVIASVLKPLTDSRAFYKLAISLRETNKYHINIIGFLEKNPPKLENIEFMSIFGRDRLHPKRLLVPFRFLSQLLHIRPELVIITTYELLLPALILKPFIGYKLVYDLQENYVKNILFNRTLNKWLKYPAAAYVQIVEKIGKSFVNHYFMAEKCFQQEFPSIKNYTVLENKHHGNVNNKPAFYLPTTAIKFILTGTLTKVYGIEEGIQWFKSIKPYFPHAQLHIVGYAPMADFRSRIRELSASSPDIYLQVSDRPLRQQAIFSAMDKADVLLLPYHSIPSIWSKIPTKIYEALAIKIPMIIPENPLWTALISSHPAGTALDYSHPNLNRLRSMIAQQQFTQPVDEEVTWESEKPKLLQLVENLIKP